MYKADDEKITLVHCSINQIFSSSTIIPYIRRLPLIHKGLYILNFHFENERRHSNIAEFVP